MKCEKCGYAVNPGDQICINCGAKLSLNNLIMPEVENIPIESEKKDNKKIIIITIGAIVIAIVIIFLIIKFLVLK